MKDILKETILAEKDSIAFYLRIKEMVSEKFGKTKIDSIIKEEMSCIKILSNKLVALKKIAGYSQLFSTQPEKQAYMVQGITFYCLNFARVGGFHIQTLINTADESLRIRTVSH